MVVLLSEEPPPPDNINERVEPAPPPLVPLRCYSCGFQVASGHALYKSLLKQGVEASVALDCCGANRICCRRMILSQPTAPDHLAHFSLHHPSR
jgi:DNA-directed RNA polymerase subunit N (RpoN/RPB10)